MTEKMQVVLIDRDEMSSELVKGYMADEGCEVIYEPDRNRVFDLPELSHTQAFFIDLSTLVNPIKYIIDLKSAVGENPYIVLMDKESKKKQALKAGANTLLDKPINKAALKEYIEQARQFSDLSKSLNDREKKFPYHKGIISNSAMNELFLSSLDRTSRYIEGASLVIFRLKNADQVREDYGDDIAQQASEWMSNNIIRLRRQSDIMAQTSSNEFMVLIQRPLFKDEPVDAARRFRAGFLQNPGNDIPEFEGKKIMLSISMSVIELPDARKQFDDTVVRP